LIVAGTVVNLRLNTQNSNTNVSLFNIEALTNEADEDDELTPEEKTMLLHGALSTIPLRSFTMPFQATKHSSYISVYYLVTLNNISVKIVNASGQIVYSNNVNPVAGGQLYISLAGLPSGDYTITFTSANGGSIYGDFEI
jgi:hypothetical protein